jgi:hypothetical protein
MNYKIIGKVIGGGKGKKNCISTRWKLVYIIFPPPDRTFLTRDLHYFYGYSSFSVGILSFFRTAP